MSTVAAPFGLVPIGRFDSGSLNPIRHFPIASGYATNIAFGDVVQLVDGGTATTIEKQASTGDTSTDIDMCGIFMGVSYTDPGSSQKWFSQLWPASTVASDAMAYVCADPQVIFKIQADAAITNANDIYGKNAVFVQTAPNTTLKISRVALSVAGISTDANNPIKIIDYWGGPEGAEPGTTYPILLCKFNYHQFSTATGAS